jgi:zinc transporter 1/2/3
MICLNKADEDAYKRLSWNQSPEPLAPESTTRQDMNGITNLRELVAGGQDADDAGGGGKSGSGDNDEKWHHAGPSPGVGFHLGGAGRWFGGLSSHLSRAVGGDGQGCLSSVISSTPDRVSRLWGWINWLLSVVVVSYLLTAWAALPSKDVAGVMSLISFSISKHASTSVSTSTATTISLSSSPNDGSGTPLVAAPSHRLGKRASTCAPGGVNADDYNLPLHVGALLIIWFVSTMACAFPLLAKRFPGLRIPNRFFFIVRHFGTGVLVATAFVHLFPTAFISLGDPCLGSFWNDDYPAMPGAIALAAIFLVTVVEMVFHPARHIKPDAVAAVVAAGSADQDESAVVDDSATTLDDGAVAADIEVSSTDSDVPARPMRSMAPSRGRSLSTGYNLNRLNTAELRELADATQVESSRRDGNLEAGEKSEPSDRGSEPLSPEQKKRKERLQCILLELGILFHSVFIGMALSVSIGNEFIILLIAIVFHQTFEGLALGARISAIKWENGAHQPWLMALAYGFTTPIGQALGIATHTLYSPGSEIGLIVVGVMNSISAGLLIYASLVELMSEDFLSDESWKCLRGKKRVMACLLVFFGALLMSLVGAWA